MKCHICGKENEKNEFCTNCDTKLKSKNVNQNVKINKNNGLLNTISYINVIIMIFYTFTNGGDGVGLLAAFMVGPFLMFPQTVLCILSLLKKTNIILNIIFIIGGLVSTIVTMSMVNYNINIFIVLNILLLIIIFVNLLNINRNKM